MKDYRIIIFAALVLLTGIGAAYWCGMSRGKASIPPPRIVRDTIRERDTIKVPEPYEVTRWVRDTEWFPVTEYVVDKDTIYAALPREEVHYEDSTYTAIVSGIKPRLDYLAIYPEKQIITVTETVQVPRNNRWGIGLQVGYGITYAGGQLHPSPYIGVGVHYDIFSW